MKYFEIIIEGNLPVVIVFAFFKTKKFFPYLNDKKGAVGWGYEVL